MNGEEIIIGDGVTSISGYPACFVYPGIYGDGYVSGTEEFNFRVFAGVGVYEASINGLPTTIIIAGDDETFGLIPDTTINPLRFTTGVASTLALTPTGTHGPFTFGLTSTLQIHCSVSGGPMPPGLSLNGDGSITGTPTLAGDYVVSVYCRDNLYHTPTFGVVFSVRDAPAFDPLTLTCGGPPAGTVGVSYFHSFPCSGGDGPYTFSLSSGAFPDGLALNGATGALTGTPTVAGVFSFRVAARDVFDAAAGVNCSITISAAVPPGAPLALTCGGPPAGTVGTAYSHTFAASGGTAPYIYSVAGGLLPAGLTLNPATGAAAGVPAAAGTFAFSISVLDADLNTVTVNCSIAIAAAAAAAGGPSFTLPQTGAFPVALPDPTKECK